jgi:hypothetical protein
MGRYQLRLWFLGSYLVQGVLDRCYHVDLINTTRVASIDSKIEMCHTLLKQHNCKLNMCELYKIGLSKYDLDQDVIQIILRARYVYEICYGRRDH